MKERTKIILPILGDLVLTGGRPVLAILLALLAGSVIILIYGSNPLQAYAAMLDGAVGNRAALANTGVRTAPLLLGGLAVAFGFKANLLNVGVEGQIYAGGAAAAAVGITPLPVPPWLHLTLAVLAGFLGGAAWGLIPAYLKAYRGVSEIVITLMMNYVGIQFASLLVHDPSPLAKPGAFYPQSPLILPSAHLPILIKGTSLHAGLILGVILAVLIYLLLKYTPFGFRTRMTGQNPEAARFAGVKVRRQIALVLLISAGLGGLAGTGEVLGLKLALYDYFASGLGYDAIAVALMANADPLGVILSALFFGALRAGAGKMQVVAGIETPISQVIQALAILFVIAIGFGESRRLARRLRREEEEEEEVLADGG
ncbi:MAG TPA: ABC transporter permease [Chloroflexi bacterium]|nr:ABC transporter permease [Chloroflexota bacterium]